MKTIKLKINITKENKLYIISLQKQQSCLIRYAYNRLLENHNKKDIETLCLNLNHIDLLDSWLKRSAIYKAESLYLALKQQQKENEDINLSKIIFGSKKNFYKRLTNKISKDEYRFNRLFPIHIIGEANQYGNRKFDLDIENNQIIFKSDRKNHLILNFHIRENSKQYIELLKIQELSQLKQLPYSIEINSEYIFITFEESMILDIKYEFINDRIMGIDLNPNYIGYSINSINNDNDNNNDNITYLLQECFDLTKLNNIEKKDKHDKYKNRKRRYETIQMAKSLIDKCLHYKVGKISIEDLNIKNKNHKKGKIFNRTVNNDWIRKLFISKLKSYASIYGITVIEVNPAYSSIIGNLIHNSYDPINASIEISRRGFYKFVKEKFYPDLKLIKDQWKKYLMSDWVGTYNEIKKSECRYRVQLEEIRCCLRNNLKSKVILYNNFL